MGFGRRRNHQRRSYAQNQPLGTYDARALEIFRRTAMKSANCNQSEKEKAPQYSATKGPDEC
jgi:hypothetical protein